MSDLLTLGIAQASLALLSLNAGFRMTGDEPVADGVVWAAVGVTDGEVDGLFPIHALAETIDEAIVHGGGLVHNSRNEGMADGNEVLLLAAYPRVADADGPMGTLLTAEEVELLLALRELHNLQGVVSGWEHHFGGLYRKGDLLAVDVEGAFGVERVSGFSVNDYLHNTLNNLYGLLVMYV